MIRVFIADDHYLIRAGFRQLAADAKDLEIVGEATDGCALLKELARTRTDVVILDIGMPGPGFVSLLEEMKRQFPRMRVLVVSMHPEGELAVEALRAGAAGYVSKAQVSTDLVAAVRKVHQGGRYVSPALAERLAAQLCAGSQTAPHLTLSARERQVLCHLGAGKSNKEIAAACSVGPKTISTYRARVLRKLHLATNADLVRYVIEHGLLS
jgi:two-component system invasion response regulator UvrY